MVGTQGAPTETIKAAQASCGFQTHAQCVRVCVRGGGMTAPVGWGVCLHFFFFQRAAWKNKKTTRRGRDHHPGGGARRLAALYTSPGGEGQVQGLRGGGWRLSHPFQCQRRQCPNAGTVNNCNLLHMLRVSKTQSVPIGSPIISMSSV